MRLLAPTVVSLLTLAPMANAQRLIAVEGIYRTLYQVNPLTGTPTTIGAVSGLASFPTSMTFDTSRNTVYLMDGSRGLFTLDVATGVSSAVSTSIPSTIPGSLTYDGANDSLYGTWSGRLYTIHRTTGVPTLVGPTGMPAMGLCYVPTTNTMYGLNETVDPYSFGQATFNWCSIDVTSGAATVIASYSATLMYVNGGFAWNADTDTIYAIASSYYSSSAYYLYTIDRATGQFTQIGSIGSNDLRAPVWLPGTGTYSNFANGCAGTLGVPGNVVVKAANIGHDFIIRATNLPRDAGIMVVGFSTSTFNGIPLPYDLAISGAPGCTAYVSADLVNLILGWPTTQTATYTTAVPGNPLLVGLHYFAQTYSFDTVNTLGLVAGDAGGGIVGQ